MTSFPPAMLQAMHWSISEFHGNAALPWAREDRITSESPYPATTVDSSLREAFDVSVQSSSMSDFQVPAVKVQNRVQTHPII